MEAATASRWGGQGAYGGCRSFGTGYGAGACADIAGNTVYCIKAGVDSVMGAPRRQRVEQWALAIRQALHLTNKSFEAEFQSLLHRPAPPKRRQTAAVAPAQASQLLQGLFFNIAPALLPPHRPTTLQRLAVQMPTFCLSTTMTISVIGAPQVGQGCHHQYRLPHCTPYSA